MSTVISYAMHGLSFFGFDINLSLAGAPPPKKKKKNSNKKTEQSIFVLAYIFLIIINKLMLKFAVFCHFFADFDCLF